MFIFAFAKADQDNLADRELVAVQALAESFANFSPADIEALISDRKWRQIHAVH